MLHTTGLEIASSTLYKIIFFNLQRNIPSIFPTTSFNSGSSGKSEVRSTRSMSTVQPMPFCKKVSLLQLRKSVPLFNTYLPLTCTAGKKTSIVEPLMKKYLEPGWRDHANQIPWWKTSLMKDTLMKEKPKERLFWWKTTLMRDHPEERPPWWETTLRKDHPDPEERPPWWETTLRKDHPDERSPWGKTTLMRDHPEERPPWWEITLRKDHPDERPPWGKTTLMRDHPEERPPWGKTTLMRDHPDERPPSWKNIWWQTTLKRETTLMRNNNNNKEDF